MPDAIFPVLPGIAWGVTKMPEFLSLTKVSPSGVDVVASLSAFPRWHFSLTYDFLRAGAEDELHKLIGFFLQCRGNVTDFLYTDPTDHRVEQQGFGRGDGKSVRFSLCRNIGSFIEPLYDTYEESLFHAGKKLTEGYRIDNGIVTFMQPPAVGTHLSWSGNFHYRCRFKEAAMEFQNFSFKLWSARNVEFISTKKVFSE